MTGTWGAAVTGVGVVVPPPDARDGAWFDTAARLGRRGYKYLPPACRYLLAAARDAVADGGRLDREPAARRAGVIGTNSALDPVLDGMDRTVAGGRADELSPAAAPFFAVNVLGARLAAEHGLKGFQLTTTSPRTAGLEAVEAGLRALAAGRCSVLLAAAMEDGLPTPDRATAPGGTAVPGGHAASSGLAGPDGFAAPGGLTTPDGLTATGGAVEQGAVVLVLERAPAGRAHGGCRVRTAFVPPARLGDAAGRERLVRLVADMLAAVGATGALPAHPVLDGSPVSEAVLAAVARVHKAEPPVPAGAGCLAPMRLLAAALTGGPGDRLIVAATGEGNIAVALAHGGGRPDGHERGNGGGSC